MKWPESRTKRHDLVLSGIWPDAEQGTRSPGRSEHLKFDRSRFGITEAALAHVHVRGPQVGCQPRRSGGMLQTWVKIRSAASARPAIRWPCPAATARPAATGVSTAAVAAGRQLVRVAAVSASPSLTAASARRHRRAWAASPLVPGWLASHSSSSSVLEWALFRLGRQMMTNSGLNAATGQSYSSCVSARRRGSVLGLPRSRVAGCRSGGPGGGG